MRTAIRTIPAALVLATATPAQGLDCVPADSALVVQVDGPATLRRKLLATNLGTLLAANEADDFRAMFRGLLDAAIERFDDRASPVLAPLARRFSDYGGRVTIAVRPIAGGPDSIGVVHCAPDPKFDLAAVGLQLAATLVEHGVELRHVEAGGEQFQYIAIGERDGAGITLPEARADGFVVFFGDDIEAAVREHVTLAAEDRFVPDARLEKSAIAVRIDLQAILAMDDGLWLRQWFSDDDDDEVRGFLGLPSLRDLTMTIGAHGPSVQLETSVGFAPGVSRGMIEGFLPATQEPPQLAGLVPDGTHYWQSAKLRVDTMIERTLDLVAWEEAEDADGFAAKREGLENEMVRLIGCHLADDLAAHLDDDVLLLGSLFGSAAPRDTDDDDDGDDGDDDGDGDASGSVLFVAQLRDPAAFDRGWGAVLGSDLGGFVPPSLIETHEDTEIHVVMFGGRVEFCWALHDDLFLIGGGDDDVVERTRAVIDRAVELSREGGDRTALPPALRRLRRAAPDGTCGCAGFAVDGLLGLPLWDELGLDGALPDAFTDQGRTAIDRLRPLLDDHQLGSAAAFIAWADDRWTYRVLW